MTPHFDLLGELTHVRWQTAFRTFGNDHATLIGLLVDWWISYAPQSRWALEGGPSFGYHARSTGGGGQCDAVLGEGDVSIGLVEVEGSRYEHTIEKMGRFFDAEYADLATLQFGILLAYPTGPVGRGRERRIPPLPLDRFVDVAAHVLQRHHDKRLVVLVLDKKWEPAREGPRSRTEYYGGRPMRVTGALIEAGREVSRQLIYEQHYGALVRRPKQCKLSRRPTSLAPAPQDKKGTAANESSSLLRDWRP